MVVVFILSTFCVRRMVLKVNRGSSIVALKQIDDLFQLSMVLKMSFSEEKTRKIFK